MLEFLSRKSKTLLGVDISSTAVKLLELSLQNGKYRIENYVIRQLPPNAVVEKNISDIDAVGESIRQAVSLLKPGTKEAAVAVAGSAVITKIIEMNASMTDSEMENQIIVEADQYIPYPLSEVAIDFERQDSGDGSSDFVDVLLAACRKENVESRVGALESGGLSAKVVDIEAYAMERAFGLLQAQLAAFDPQTVAILTVPLLTGQALPACAAAWQDDLYTRAIIWWPAIGRGRAAALRSVCCRGRNRHPAQHAGRRLRTGNSVALQGRGGAADQSLPAVLLFFQPVQRRGSDCPCWRCRSNRRFE